MHIGIITSGRKIGKNGPLKLVYTSINKNVGKKKKSTPRY